MKTYQFDRENQPESIEVPDNADEIYERKRDEDAEQDSAFAQEIFKRAIRAEFDSCHAWDIGYKNRLIRIANKVGFSELAYEMMQDK
jgi:hypothetical protein